MPIKFLVEIISHIPRPIDIRFWYNTLQMFILLLIHGCDAITNWAKRLCLSVCYHLTHVIHNIMVNVASNEQHRESYNLVWYELRSLVRALKLKLITLVYKGRMVEYFNHLNFWDRNRNNKLSENFMSIPGKVR